MPLERTPQKNTTSSASCPRERRLEAGAWRARARRSAFGIGQANAKPHLWPVSLRETRIRSSE
eukprot:11588460-Alexandrium_andersonii.AAC.1